MDAPTCGPADLPVQGRAGHRQLNDGCTQWMAVWGAYCRATPTHRYLNGDYCARHTPDPTRTATTAEVAAAHDAWRTQT